MNRFEICLKEATQNNEILVYAIHSIKPFYKIVSTTVHSNITT